MRSNKETGVMHRGWVSAAGLLGGLGVALGAFGAHGLKERLTPDLLAVFEVGVRYQMYHVIAILALAAATRRADNPWPNRACAAWAVGIVIFSGSLYALALTGLRWLGAITPIGGVAFIVGWCAVIAAGLRKDSAETD